tara:strand:- start:5321 stop:5539 length:219 start_codon:yes stop_codon:yes gene_type:complete
MHHFNFIQFFVTIGFFYIEALIHYNIGKKGKLGFSIPNWKQNKLILGVIAVFSFVSCMITALVQNMVDELNK